MHDSIVKVKKVQTDLSVSIRNFQVNNTVSKLKYEIKLAEELIKRKLI